MFLGQKIALDDTIQPLIFKRLCFGRPSLTLNVSKLKDRVGRYSLTFDVSKLKDRVWTIQFNF